MDDDARQPAGGSDPADASELADFIICPECGQAVDTNDIAAVFHHGVPGHKRIPTS